MFFFLHVHGLKYERPSNATSYSLSELAHIVEIYNTNLVAYCISMHFHGNSMFKVSSFLRETFPSGSFYSFQVVSFRAHPGQKKTETHGRIGGPSQSWANDVFFFPEMEKFTVSKQLGEFQWHHLGERCCNPEQSMQTSEMRTDMKFLLSVASQMVGFKHGLVFVRSVWDGLSDINWDFKGWNHRGDKKNPEIDPLQEKSPDAKRWGPNTTREEILLPGYRFWLFLLFKFHI